LSIADAVCKNDATGSRALKNTTKMKTTKIVINITAVAWVGFSIVLLQAQELVITSFPGNGQLTWTNAPATNAFAVEWAPAVTGPWSRSWDALDSVVSTNSRSAVSVPMFYRVSQGFTSAALRGPWMLTGLGTNVGGEYIIFDGAGTINETASFNNGIPSGYYTVQTKDRWP
jgi:hypothetical protein